MHTKMPEFALLKANLSEYLACPILTWHDFTPLALVVQNGQFGLFAKQMSQFYGPLAPLYENRKNRSECKIKLRLERIEKMIPPK